MTGKVEAIQGKDVKESTLTGINYNDVKDFKALMAKKLKTTPIISKEGQELASQYGYIPANSQNLTATQW